MEAAKSCLRECDLSCSDCLGLAAGSVPLLVIWHVNNCVCGLSLRHAGARRLSTKQFRTLHCVHGICFVPALAVLLSRYDTTLTANKTKQVVYYVVTSKCAARKCATLLLLQAHGGGSSPDTAVWTVCLGQRDVTVALGLQYTP